jgi:hypothetical protein
VNAPPVLDTGPSSPADPLSAEPALGLAALLEIFTSEDTAEVAAPTRSTLRARGARLQAWTREQLRRATLWGAGPGGAWRAW